MRTKIHFDQCEYKICLCNCVCVCVCERERERERERENLIYVYRIYINKLNEQWRWRFTINSSKMTYSIAQLTFYPFCAFFNKTL